MACTSLSQYWQFPVYVSTKNLLMLTCIDSFAYSVKIYTLYAVMNCTLLQSQSIHFPTLVYYIHSINIFFTICVSFKSFFIQTASHGEFHFIKMEKVIENVLTKLIICKSEN